MYLFSQEFPHTSYWWLYCRLSALTELPELVQQFWTDWRKARSTLTSTFQQLLFKDCLASYPGYRANEQPRHDAKDRQVVIVVYRLASASSTARGYLHVRAYPSLVPRWARPRPAFRRLQYAGAWERTLPQPVNCFRKQG